MQKLGTKVTLYSKELEEEREFDIEHAENILNIEMRKKRNGWVLPENSNFELSENGKLISRTSARSDKETKKQKSDSNGD